MSIHESQALRMLRDELYRQRNHCLAVQGSVPESLLSLWNLTRWYLGEVEGEQPIIAPRSVWESTAPPAPPPDPAPIFGSPAAIRRTTLNYLRQRRGG